MKSTIAAVVLAAGTSSRFGTNKLVLPFHGETVIRRVTRTTLEAGASPVVVVTGHEREAIIAALHDMPVVFAHNPSYQAGERASSIKTGLRHLLDHAPAAQAALIVLGDQPLVRPLTIRKLMQAFTQGCGSILAPRHGHERGNPVLIGRVWWQEALRLQSEASMKALLRSHPASLAYVLVNDVGVVRDVDTPELYQRALRGE